MLDAAQKDGIVQKDGIEDIQEHVSRARLALPSDHPVACADNGMC